MEKILVFSPSYKLSQALPFMNVENLCALALRFDKIQRFINCGHGSIHNLPVRQVGLSATNPIGKMILIAGTTYFAYLDQFGSVHIADVTTGQTVHSWSHPRTPEKIKDECISLWESASNGLVLVVVLSKDWCVSTCLG
jgi:hypothetical protein